RRLRGWDSECLALSQARLRFWVPTELGQGHADAKAGEGGRRIVPREGGVRRERSIPVAPTEQLLRTLELFGRRSRRRIWLSRGSTHGNRGDADEQMTENTMHGTLPPPGSRANAMASRIAALSPHCSVNAHGEFVDRHVFLGARAA